MLKTKVSIYKFRNKFIIEDEIPLLIIDVNIRPGEKKKINVYDGDTAELLASRFAKEHSKFYNIIIFRLGQENRRNTYSIDSIPHV